MQTFVCRRLHWVRRKFIPRNLLKTVLEKSGKTLEKSENLWVRKSGKPDLS